MNVHEENAPLRVLIADPEPRDRANLQGALRNTGHMVVGTTGDAVEAICMARSLEPSLVIFDLGLENMDSLKMAEHLYKERIAPSLLLGMCLNPGIVRRASGVGVFSILSKPIPDTGLSAAAIVAVAGWHALRAGEQKVADLQATLEKRELIDCAKDLLISVKGLSETEAHRWLQQRSMNLRRPITSIARAVLIALKTSAPDSPGDTPAMLETYAMDSPCRSASPISF